MFEKDIHTSAPIHPLLANRWSGRAYDAGRDVSDDTLRSVCEAGRWAPSCFGDQPWRYVICSRARDPEAWQKAYDCLAPGNQAWAANAPVLILTCADSEFSSNGKPNPWSEYDCGAASLSICLQATNLGLMTHQMGGFSKEKACESFALPQRYRPVAMMSLGYQLPREAVPEEMREKEFAPRRRDPLREHFFLGAWGEGLE